MSEERLLRAIKGVFLFVTFIVMGASLPDANALTLTYLAGLGVSFRLFQFLFLVSGVANLIIGLKGYSWNALFFAVWVTYTVAATVGYISGSNLPLLAVSAYVLLSVFMVIDVLEDTELLQYIGTKI